MTEIIETEQNKEQIPEQEKEQDKPNMPVNLKVYRRDYYRNKYHQNDEFREQKKLTNKARYNRLTKDCEKCGSRIKKEVDEVLCISCKLGNIEQTKCNRGRKKKIKFTNACLKCESENNKDCKCEN